MLSGETTIVHLHMLFSACYTSTITILNSQQMIGKKLQVITQGRIQVFKLGGSHLKKLRRVEGGAKIFGVFRVKNHDFAPKNHIFSNCGGRRENFWGISCEKSRFYAKKSYFFLILGGARAGCAPHPGSAPVTYSISYKSNISY